MVVAHEGSRLSLLLESQDDLPECFASARFEVSETQLLECMKECMQELCDNGDVGPCPKVAWTRAHGKRATSRAMWRPASKTPT